MQKFLSTVILSCTVLLAIAGGKEVTIKNVKSYAIGTEDQSLAQVKQKALNEAKLIALQQAGVTEQITAYSDFITKEENNQIEEIFNSNILNDLQGVVVDSKVLSESKTITDQGFIRVDVVANITVLKFSSGMDASFDIWVDGIQPSYNQGDQLSFKVKPNKDAFLRAFIITESNEAFQLFPSEFEGDFQLKEKQDYKFPHASIQYELTANSSKEAHRLILVSLKVDVPYNTAVSYKALMDWIFQIPPDQRRITTFSFEVYGGKR